MTHLIKALLGAVLLNSGIYAAICTTDIAVATPVAPQIAQLSSPANQSANSAVVPLSQITSVSQLSDVQPTDWAFQALQSLVERYGCIAGYPDGTYRGNQALTRYEFAAGLNACLDRVNELIATSKADSVTKADLATLQRLQEEFAAELATLRGQVEALEASTAELEANQFSTTTKLNAEIIVAASDDFGDDVEGNAVLQDRIRLNFDSSFTGEDRLRVRLQAANFAKFPYIGEVTNEGRLAFDNDTDNNDALLSDISYRFPVGEVATVWLFATGGEQDDFLTLVDPILFSSGGGAISRFGQFNPIYNSGGQNAGLAVDFQFTEAVKLSLSYLAGTPQDPTPGSGLFDGSYSAAARLAYATETFQIAVAYLHTYSDEFLNTSESGSLRAQLNLGLPLVGNSYGIEASLGLSPKIRISGWVGYTDAILIGIGGADVWNYAATLSFLDVGKEGNLLAFVVGQEPKLTGTTGFTVLGRRDDPDTSLHVEALYKYQLTDNISITPGVIWLTAPGHDSDNSDIVIGTIRTTFEF